MAQGHLLGHLNFLIFLVVLTLTRRTSENPKSDGAGANMPPQGKLAIFAVFLHSRQQKSIKGLFGHKGGPVLVLQWTL